MIVRINSKENELALIVRSNFQKDGLQFFTDDQASQQLGYSNREAGYVIPPHFHNPVKREIYNTVEVLLIKSGRVRIDFYDENQDYLESYIVSQGDVVLIALGGHGFEMLEASEIIEIKQGPYVDDKDRTRFQQIDKNQVKIIS
jgi:hypothetical protein